MYMQFCMLHFITTNMAAPEEPVHRNWVPQSSSTAETYTVNFPVFLVQLCLKA